MKKIDINELNIFLVIPILSGIIVHFTPWVVYPLFLISVAVYGKKRKKIKEYVASTLVGFFITMLFLDMSLRLSAH